jgi:predicted ABC-class ATPase
MGADTLLIDEDTCATNFMIRDAKMMQLVAPDKEPITPFVHVIRSLYDDKGISSVLVIGGVGDYFDVADNVVMLDCYKCLDVTERAKTIVVNARSAEGSSPIVSVAFGTIRSRHLVGPAFAANGKVRVSSKGNISYGDTELDLSALEQLVTKSQTMAISNALQRLPSLALHKHKTLPESLLVLEKIMNEQGLDALTPSQFHGGMSKPRRFELAGAVNRLRRDLSVVQQDCWN